jgi:hypothetical protein
MQSVSYSPLTSTISTSANVAKAAVSSLNAKELLAKEEIDRAKSGLDKASQDIGLVPSFVLIINNTIGPAMMGLPRIFQRAGIIPTMVTIISVTIMTSLTCTCLADTIASIPGNKHFSKEISFSMAFKYIIGPFWFTVVEILFIVSCLVQVSASLVETAQSLDGFLASFLVGKTYAIELIPSLPRLVDWSPSECVDNDLIESSLEDCTPFHHAGDYVLTLGYFLTTLFYMPFGKGHLNGTMIIQYVSFGFFILCTTVFLCEFINGDWAYIAKVTWFGDDYSQLAGVVLFNFAFCTTVPSWLAEKEENVDVNSVIWSSTTLSCFFYIIFGFLAAISFDDAGSNTLVLLSSNKVHLATRVAAALFGVAIIGAGVPVFCIIVKSTLYNSGTCSAKMAVFIGCVLPYLTSWTIYQGEFLISLLNWTGLVLHGLVAFVLPLILCIKAIEYTVARGSMSSDEEEPNESINKSSLYYQSQIYQHDKMPHSLHTSNSTLSQRHIVQPLPPCLEPYRKKILTLIVSIFFLIITWTIIHDFDFGVDPTEARDRRRLMYI